MDKKERDYTWANLHQKLDQIIDLATGLDRLEKLGADLDVYKAQLKEEYRTNNEKEYNH